MISSVGEAAEVSEFTKAAVNTYRASLEERKLSASTINQRLSAVRKLAVEAADNGLMPANVAAAISRVKGAKRAGVRTGHWLTREQAENLISAPNAATNNGKRDRALLAVLIGCGLRRREAAALTIEHIQLRDARWVIVDLVGKGGRVRSVPMPSWTKSAIDSWIEAREITSGLVFRSLTKGGGSVPRKLRLGEYSQWSNVLVRRLASRSWLLMISDAHSRSSPTKGRRVWSRSN